MNKYEGICAAVGSIIGALLTGVAVYFTKSIWSALICLACSIAGLQLGRYLDEKKSKSDSCKK